MQTPIPSSADPDGWALFLDIDGTLLDLAAAPDRVVVPASLLDLLDCLTARLSGALALVSGRSQAEIDRLFPQSRDAAGSHGAELRLQGRPAIFEERQPDHMNALFAAVERQAHRLPGVLFERKPRSVAFHFRSAPQQAEAVAALAEAVVGKGGGDLRLLHGKGVVELVPSKVSKGTAIERFMQFPPYLGRIPVFVGDDVTDEDGFLAVNRLGGISIHVGETSSAARFRLSSPSSVRDWLGGLNQLMGGIVENDHA